MILWPWTLVFASTPACFASRYDLDESVRRLAEATGRSIFSAITRQRAVGAVSRDRVSLHREIPFFENSFTPYFRGEFCEIDGRTQLTGSFGRHPFSKLFTVFWFGGIFLVGVVSLVQQLAVKEVDWHSLAEITGLFFASWGWSYMVLGFQETTQRGFPA